MIATLVVSILVQYAEAKSPGPEYEEVAYACSGIGIMNGQAGGTPPQDTALSAAPTSTRVPL